MVAGHRRRFGSALIRQGETNTGFPARVWVLNQSDERGLEVLDTTVILAGESAKVEKRPDRLGSRGESVDRFVAELAGALVLPEGELAGDPLDLLLRAAFVSEPERLPSLAHRASA